MLVLFTEMLQNPRDYFAFLRTKTNCVVVHTQELLFFVVNSDRLVITLLLVQYKLKVKTSCSMSQFNPSSSSGVKELKFNPKAWSRSSFRSKLITVIINQLLKEEYKKRPSGVQISCNIAQLVILYSKKPVLPVGCARFASLSAVFFPPWEK